MDNITQMRGQNGAGAILSPAAVARITREDLAYEERARRSGLITGTDAYGFAIVFRDTLSGAIQHSMIYRTRAEAIEVAYNPERIAQRLNTIAEAIVPVRTSFPDAQVAA